MSYELRAATVIGLILIIPYFGYEPASAQDTGPVMRTDPALVLQTGDDRSVSVATFSPDGRFVLTGSDDGTVRLWDVASGRELRHFTGHVGGIKAIAFSPDGRLALTGGADKTARLWDVASGRQLQRLTGGLFISSPIGAVAFSPDGRKALTDTSYETASLWDTGSGKELQHGKFSSAGPVLAATMTNKKELMLTQVEFTEPQIVDGKSGKRLQRLVGQSARINVGTFSSDGRLLLTGSTDGTARLWDTTNGQELQHFVGPSWSINAVALSRDNRLVLTAGIDKTAQLWDAATGRELRRFVGHSSSVESASLSPDGRLLITGGDFSDRTLRLWDATNGQELRRFGELPDSVNLAAFSPDGRLVLKCKYDKAWLWDAMSRSELQLFPGHSEITALALSPDGRQVLTGNGDGTAFLWDAAGGVELRRFGEPQSGYPSAAVTAVAFSPDRRTVLTGNHRGAVRLWDAASGQELRSFEGLLSSVNALAFSPDGQTILAGSENGTAQLRDVKDGRVLKSFVGYSMEMDWERFLQETGDLGPYSRGSVLFNAAEPVRLYYVRKADPVTSGVFTPDGLRALTGDLSGARLWDVASGKELQHFVERLVSAVAISPDGQAVLTGGDDGVARLWGATSGKEIQHFIGHANRVTSVAFSPDGRTVMTGSWDSTIRLWEAATGKELCRFISFPGGSWVVVTPDGRFDTNNLEDVKSLNWVAPDDPLRVLPLEIFMRDYYEPRLWTRLLSGEQMPHVPDLSRLDRVQPQVRITEIKPQASAPDAVTVTVEVENASGTFARDGKQITVESDVYDLRLFRDGQLVGYAPERDGPLKLESGKAIVTFKDIKLPRRADLNQVEFSAYAFNVDRVKSETARQTYILPRPLPEVKGRAYIISVGVNAYENPALDLSFAATDARRVQSVLTERLKAAGEYEEVVPVTLISDYETAGGRRTVTTRQATKGNVRLVLDLLAGKQVAAEQLAAIPNADKLRQAQPEDLVLIFFAGHGYADEAGRFYFVTYDTGPGTEREVTPALLQRSISSDELSLWLRGVDAGDLAMIVDACQSAAAVEGEGFKPGPMGSRGLGQLAYDKGMRVLAATQADNVALENRQIRQGLLTYALVHDGIELGRADFRPEDKRITLAEWLAYGAGRVPELFGEVEQGQVRSREAGADDPTNIIFTPAPAGDRGGGLVGASRVLIQGKRIGLTGKVTPAEEQYQRPSLFDFSRRKRDVLLVRKP